MLNLLLHVCIACWLLFGLLLRNWQDFVPRLPEGGWCHVSPSISSEVGSDKHVDGFEEVLHKCSGLILHDKLLQEFGLECSALQLK